MSVPRKSQPTQPITPQLPKGAKIYLPDEATRKRYVERGMNPFRPLGKTSIKAYYEVPEDVIESRRELVLWAKDAVRVAEGRD